MVGGNGAGAAPSAHKKFAVCVVSMLAELWLKRSRGQGRRRYYASCR